MEITVEVASLILILVTIIFSYQGFAREGFAAKYHFQVEKILTWKEYHRLLSGNFLHSNWPHLILNMYALFIFGQAIGFLPVWYFLLIYFLSMLGGDLIALYINRYNPSYTAVGASGAVNGIIFAAAAYFPNSTLELFFLIPTPFWLFAIIYLAYTVWGIRSKSDNIGHEAHLGGAIVGILMAIAWQPAILSVNAWFILLLALPIVIFFLIILFRPEALVVPSLLFKKNTPKEPSHVSETIIRPMRSKNSSPKFKSTEEEIDYLLDKGVDNLTPREKRRLDELSGNI